MKRPSWPGRGQDKGGLRGVDKESKNLMLMNENSFVVPANAGTHNHRSRWDARSTPRVDTNAQTDKSEAVGPGVRRDDDEGLSLNPRPTASSPAGTDTRRPRRTT